MAFDCVTFAFYQTKYLSQPKSVKDGGDILEKG